MNYSKIELEYERLFSDERKNINFVYKQFLKMRKKLNKLYTAVLTLVEDNHDVPESLYNDWTIEERKKFVLNFYKWNGNPENYDDNFLTLSSTSIIHYLDNTQEHIGIKNVDSLKNFLQSMFYSWNNDTPPEVFWTGNEFLEWLETQFNIKLENRFDENKDDSFKTVFEEIKSKLS